MLEPIYSGEDVKSFHRVVRGVPVARDVARYAVRIASASRPRTATAASFASDWIEWGAGLRAAQSMVLGAKARALLIGRAHVTAEDIRALAHPVLRHRILLNYRAEADGIQVEQIIDKLIEEAPSP